MESFFARQKAVADPIPSSSPAFATPAHPVRQHSVPPIPPPQLRASILPIQLPPQTLRPHAFRTLTNKYNLNFRPTALVALANFIGRHCGSRWREDGLAEGVLDEVARTWKKLHSDKIVEDGDELKVVLKSLEGCMSGGRVMQGKSALSRQGSFAMGGGSVGNDSQNGGDRPSLNTESSFGMSSLDVEDEDDEDVSKDPRDWIKVVDAFAQPRLAYNTSKKNFEKTTTKPSLFPPPSAKTDLFRQRYHLVHQRILRNEQFQPPSITTQSPTSAFNNKITAIANLLGRSGSSHLLLGLLTILPAGQLALADLTGAIVLDLQHARALPANSSYFTPGMIVLIDGVYEEDYGDTSTATTAIGGNGGVGGTIGGKFIASVLGHPPCERRAATLGIPDTDGPRLANAGNVTGPGFGWTDFLGLGSERAIGSRMRRLETRLLGPGAHAGNGKVAIAAECRLDVPATLNALRTMLRTYASLESTEFPMAIVLVGNFATNPALSGAPGAEAHAYAQGFEALASVLAEFADLVARTTLVFVPGDNDAWPSAASAGAASPVPRKGVPEMFRGKVESAVKAANREVGGSGKRKEGCVEWCSNPGRLTWFNGTSEMVLWRDDVLGRMRRNGVRFKSDEAGREDSPMNDAGTADTQRTTAADDTMDVDTAAAAPPQTTLVDQALDPDTLTARRLTKTLLDQSHLAPFPLDKRPVHWAYASSLHLYPLPTALVVADAEAPPFALNYMGCCVINPGCVVEGRRGERARWVEYDVVKKKGIMKLESNDVRR